MMTRCASDWVFATILINQNVEEKNRIKKAPQGRSFDDEDELISAVPPSCARGYRCKPV